MKKMQYLAFILVAVLLNACSDKFIEMKKSPCALKDLNKAFLRGTHV
ncbi:type IV secretion system protein VirB7 [Helicobacter pylori]